MVKGWNDFLCKRCTGWLAAALDVLQNTSPWPLSAWPLCIVGRVFSRYGRTRSQQRLTERNPPENVKKTDFDTVVLGPLRQMPAGGWLSMLTPCVLDVHYRT